MGTPGGGRKPLVTKEEALRRFQERKREAQIEAAAREGFNLCSTTAPVSQGHRQRALSSTSRHYVEDFDMLLDHHVEPGEGVEAVQGLWCC